MVDVGGSALRLTADDKEGRRRTWFGIVEYDIDKDTKRLSILMT